MPQKTQLKVELLATTPEPEKIVTAAAKLCYSASDINSLLKNLTADNVDKFIKMLESLGHTSPFEHVNFTFGVEGVSRSLLAQLSRHRIASYSVQSQRYVKLDNFEYVMPPAIEANPRTREIFIQAMEQDQEAYNTLVKLLIQDYVKSELIANGEWKDCNAFKFMDAVDKLGKKYEKQAIEDARYVFSNACETKIVFTMNARSLFNFFQHRCCNRAQWEIQELAYQMLMLVRAVAPNVFRHAGPNCLTKPCPEGKMCCGKIKEVREKFA